MLGFLAVGVFYPAIGLLAIFCMLAPVVMAPFKGRYWCGNFCPRGSLYDNVIAKISPGKPIPAFFRSKALRLAMIILIMTMFTVQTYYAWDDLAAMGKVFIRLILITTIVGVILGVIYHQRTWCTFCPMGTIASWFSVRKRPLAVADSCVNCKLCSNACPLQLAPYTAKSAVFDNPDCIKCGRCTAKCPKKALSFLD